MDPQAEAIFATLSAEGDLMTSMKVSGEIPLDPSDPAWQKSKETSIPLVSQTSVIPRTPTFKNLTISVRSLFNRKEMGLLIAWGDATKDEIDTGETRFRDGVAVGLPINFGPGTPLPYIGMGNKGRPVNIWHWKASWQADVDRGYQGVAETYSGMVPNIAPIPHRTADEAGSPMAQLKRKSPVENLMAEGFGTLTSVADETLTGKGVWRDGRWSVVIKRKLSKVGLIPITFAVWDGSSAERNGMKGLTRWRFLRFEGEAVPLVQVKDLMIGPVPGADANRGKQLVSEMGCLACHNLPGSPAVNDVGPDLIHAGSIHRPEYLLESIKDPNAVIVPAPGYYDPKTWTSTMPSFGDQIPEKDYNDVVEYLRSLQ
jgi:complex iron-sulfur molybdoenzyme family reductase subunit gamma